MTSRRGERAIPTVSQLKRAVVVPSVLLKGPTGDQEEIKRGQRSVISTIAHFYP
jgi:hypothetical protein